ncbi:MAG: hypothetical protein MUF04_02720 [Akkermansiaceae bacterium]|nr:hypothetical protein [Akkermansiaceae bacterium]
MAWHIAQAVVRGEIDNTVEGLTTGKIWLAGCETPLHLRLQGDCWRDLAGTRLAFDNPAPTPCAETTGLALEQHGVVGDMTASRKCPIPADDEDEWCQPAPKAPRTPRRWHNQLYLEWFSDFNGRVVIEATDFKLRVSGHVWDMDEDAEQAQQLANLHAMREFMALVIQRREDSPPGDETGGELDEFAWEELLKEHDRMTDAYREVLEKYLHDEDRERKEAFVMGWDCLLDELAEREEAEAGEDEDDDGDWLAADGWDDDPDDGGKDDYGLTADGGSADPEDSHPLQLHAREIARMAMDVADQEAGPGSPSYELISNLFEVSGRLAGALNGPRGGFHPETGFVLAILKRCLNWLNLALGACQQLHASGPSPRGRSQLRKLHRQILALRDGIVEIRRDLRKS